MYADESNLHVLRALSFPLCRLRALFFVLFLFFFLENDDLSMTSMIYMWGVGGGGGGGGGMKKSYMLMRCMDQMRFCALCPSV